MTGTTDYHAEAVTGRCRCGAPMIDGRCAWVETVCLGLGFTSSATITELHPHLVAWAHLYGIDPPRLTTVRNWAWRSDQNGWPTPVAERQINGRWVREYDVLEVLRWFTDYAARRGS